MSVPRGLRNNNPGNIEQGAPWQGLAPEQTDPRFAQFVSPEYGIRAMAKVLGTYQTKHGLMTPREMIGRWAPASENNVNAYVDAVASYSGLNPDVPVDMTKDGEKLIAAMIQHENGLQPFPAETITAGVKLAQNTTQSNDAIPRIKALQAELERRDRVKTLQEELVKRKADAATVPDAPKATALEQATQAAGTIVGDLQAGLQGVNPISTQRQQPIGIVQLVPGSTDKYVIDQDGVWTPIEKFDPAKTVVMLDGRTGQMYAYERTKEIEESGLASIGRLLGYAVLGGGASVPKAAAIAAAAPKASNVVPSLSMVTPRIAGAMESWLPTAGPVVKDTNRALGELKGEAERIAGIMGPGASNFDAGEALLRGADWFAERFKTKAGELYDQVGKVIPKAQRFDMPATSAALNDMVKVFSDTPALAQAVGVSKYQKWLDDLSGGLTWDAARQLRSDIGEAIGKISGPMATEAQGRLKQLYGSLTRDMEAAARTAGPEALASWKRANAFYAEGQRRIDTALNKIMGVAPERAAANFMAIASKDSPRASLNSLRTVIKTLPEDEMKVVAATILRRMGLATSGAQDAAGGGFSAATFLTNWNKLSVEAKSMLFSRTLPSGVLPELDEMVRLIAKAKAVNTQVNYSRSATTLATLLTGGAMLADPVTTIGGSVAANIGARIFTSRPFLKALNTGLRNGDLTSLRAISEGKGPLAIEAQTILRQLLATEVPLLPDRSRESIPALPAAQ